MASLNNIHASNQEAEQEFKSVQFVPKPMHPIITSKLPHEIETVVTFIFL